MIFKDIITEKSTKIISEIDRLLEYAWKNQNHVGNLLLISENGFFQESILEWNKWQEKKMNPHSIGPGMEGLSEHTHYKFIDKYRSTHIHELNHPEYVKQFIMESWDKEISDRNDGLRDIEETTIQLEMLIYLKFWEADTFIKKLYQFVRILLKQDYDWYFKISNSNRNKDSTGSRQDIIRLKIRDQIKNLSPLLYNLIKETYNTQIRNSIAHSNYSFLNRTIGLNNYIATDQAAQLKGLSFDEWIDIFHNTLTLHNAYIHMHNSINNHYASIAMQNNMTVPIRITEKDGKQYELLLEYRDAFQDWHYKQTN